MLFSASIKELNELAIAAEGLLKAFPDARIFLFDAGMGMGKTTFIKELCACLGSNDHVSSPTYSLVNEYVSPKGSIFHFDLYRLKDTGELEDIGFVDYLHQQAFMFIEWPHPALPLLRGEKVIRVKITAENQKRLITAEMAEIS
jgi:tRNA threonylcarbamoyladenosine biosynthesis protein TsaE